MRAVWLRAFGGPEVLVPGDAPDPVPGPGQALIEVAFANVTFVETQFRATGAGPFAATLPMIPGNGVGGVVAAVGPDVPAGVTGRRAISTTGGSGGYAELVAVDAGALIDVPPKVPLNGAVAVLADGRTAIALMRAAGVGAGDRVLVEAAAGGVGTLLVQLARAAGATVVGVAGGPRKLEVARAMGAQVVTDYRDPAWPGAVRAAVGAVDVVFDGVGGPIARTAFDLLATGGRMLSFGLASGAWADVPAGVAAARGVAVLRGLPIRRGEMRGLTVAALAEAEAGRLRPLIGQRFPLERAADAHAAIEARQTVGKTLLEAPGAPA